AGSTPDGTIGGVMKPVEPSPPGAPAGWRVWLLPATLVAGGVLAWVFAVLLVLSPPDEDGEAEVPAQPTVVAIAPTLAPPTATPTDTPTDPPTLPPSESPGTAPSATFRTAPTATDAPTLTPEPPTSEPSTPEPSATPIPPTSTPAPTERA